MKSNNLINRLIILILQEKNKPFMSRFQLVPEIVREPTQLQKSEIRGCLSKSASYFFGRAAAPLLPPRQAVTPTCCWYSSFDRR